MDEVESFIPLDSSQKTHHRAQSMKKKPQPSGQNEENGESLVTDKDGEPGGHKRRFSMEELFKQGNALGHELGWLII